MNDAYIGGMRIRLDPAKAIGKGGEADIFDIGNGRVLKVFKTASHPDLAGSPESQRAAEMRNAEHQKKLRAFPAGLPANVIAPLELATDKSGVRIVGYAMRFVRGTELLRYGERSFRATVPHGDVVAIFRALHSTVGGVHRMRVVIGDFNDLNVLVAGTTPALIDADSCQFGGFPCRVYTERFVDPILCDPSAARPMLAKPHNEHSDWYAFAVMLMKSLLFVEPYGGVYVPKNGRPMPHPTRPLQRITVFHPDVRYPKPAIPYGVLPDDLLQHFHRVFEKDQRGTFPLFLLESLRWTTCAACGSEHARAKCPTCATAAPAAIKQTVVIRGKVTATTLFKTSGIILRAAMHHGGLAWLSHENDKYLREDGSVVMHGALMPNMRYRLRGKTTVLGQGGQAVVMTPGKPPETLTVDAYAGTLPVFAANELHIYWTDCGRLLHDNAYAPEHVGDVLSGQTLIWAGPAFGFGIYRAGGLSVAFTFDAVARGINDTVRLPRLRGKLITASCTFTMDRCWFFTAMQEDGRTVNRVVLIKRDGTIEATAETDAGDGGWLSRFGGACAGGTNLFVPTDEGIVRVEPQNGTLAATQTFPDTEPFVDATSKLYSGTGCIIAVNRKEIITLKISP